MLKRFCSRESGSVGNAVAWCVVVLMLAVTGCGGDSVPEEYSGPPSVSGTVMLDGTPLVAATVSFETSESGPFRAVTNSLGQYVFENEEAIPPLGKYLVRITRSADPEAANSGAELQALPARYN
ncbi:MAG: carboxypeptidase-like regulatory domain-containing protein, partial [Planctomycetota bacterium]|nr:carboxypeptidase-like regulatory domain-containing protein [Planctomycetota bacterium]